MTIVPILSFVGCSDDNDDKFKDDGKFKDDDKDSNVIINIDTTTEVGQLWYILSKMDANDYKTRGPLNITDVQFNEIATFTEELVENSTKDTLTTIFEWVNKNVKYGHEGVDPYDVFQGAKTNCQGYANLMRTMCLSQDIPVIGINGWLGGDQPQGHAWIYVYFNGKWHVCDALNNFIFNIEETVKYESLLIPWMTDIPLFEEGDFVFDFNEGLNIWEIKGTSKSIVLPETMLDMNVSSVVLEKDLPVSVSELTLSRYISRISRDGTGLVDHAPNLENIKVAEGNKSFETFEGILYQLGSNSEYPYFIPGKMKIIKLKPISNVGKGLVYGHQHVEEIYFTGTENIESYAVEDCPRLKNVYVPKGTKIQEHAFPESTKIIEIEN